MAADEDIYLFLKSTIKELIAEKGIKGREAKDLLTSTIAKVGTVIQQRYDLGFFHEGAPMQDPKMNYVHLCSQVVRYHSLGDTLGYKNGDWEFNYGNPKEGPEYINEMIYEFFELGGVNELDIRGWRVSDDTLLYNATLRALVLTVGQDIDAFGERVREEYLDSVESIANRHPGETTRMALREQKRIKWNELEYDSEARGAGSAMRTGCIGIFYPGRQMRKELVARAVEASRITHNSASAILGSITTALFTALGLERIDVSEWPHELFVLIRSGLIDEYLQESRPDEYHLYKRDHHLFVRAWEDFLRLIPPGRAPRDETRRMKNPVERYRYLIENFSRNCGTPGGCADDATIMAYDAVRRSGGNVEKLILYSVLHPGDSDTVGSIAFSWFAAYYLDQDREAILGNMIADLEVDVFSTKTFSKMFVDQTGDVLWRQLAVDVAKKVFH